jgi:beta-phosphoglucomutase-like phosphatase (HAD superfamily)
VAEALADISLTKAVASNSSSKRVQAALSRTGLSPFFGARIYTADTVGRPKPHPAVYLAAAAGFGVAPGACIAIEDSVTGVIAAATAGMYVLGFTGGGHINTEQGMQLKAAGAHSIFENMAQLPALIQGLRNRY